MYERKCTEGNVKKEKCKKGKMYSIIYHCPGHTPKY